MECLEGCEFQKFANNKFNCDYYNALLVTEYGTDDIKVYRCKACIDEGKIGVSEEANLLAGIRNTLVYLGDHFYSFKDAFEDDLAELYRNLKVLEDKMKEGD